MQHKNNTMRAMETIRRRIFSGELAGGDRLYEEALANDLDMSRTPVRNALALLVGEGMLDRRPKAGFVVPSFSFSDVSDAIQLRGVLEGMAARFAAERGVSDEDLAPIIETSESLDKCFDFETNSVDLYEYSRLNILFHDQLAELSMSRLLIAELERVKRLPFASPAAFIPDEDDLKTYTRSLAYGHQQHHVIIASIRDGEGGRAEALAREHAREASRNLEAVFKQKEGISALRGHALIVE